MAKSKVYEKGQADVSFNMTPMIDCTFQLILFFMLATQMASKDYVQMEIPKPEESIAKAYEEPKAVINVVPFGEREVAVNPSREGEAKMYQMGTLGFKPTEVDKLGKVVETTRREIRDEKERKAWVVEIRADKNLEYAAVQPVLEQLQGAKQEKIRITAMPKLMSE